MKLFHVMSIVTVVAITFVAGCSQPAEQTEATAAEAAQVAAADVEGFVDIDSSLLDKVKYDAGSQMLTILFEDGDSYGYEAVPQDVYDALMASDSQGKYFVANIKEKYTFKKQ